MVVRNTGRLSDQTRERVRESMDALGYVYHRGAANLRTQRSGLIGLLITDVSNPFFSAMTLGFEEAAAEGGYLTMVSDTFDDAGRQERLAQSMLEYPIDALAYTPVVSNDLAAKLTNYPVPLLAVTRQSEGGAPYLGPDDYSGGLLAGEHLVDHHSYRRLVYLGGPHGAGPREERMRGVRDAAARQPGAELVAELNGITSVAGGMRLAQELIESRIEFDAVVCHSDVVAYALLHALRQIGRESIGVIGFDGLPESELFWPSVTSVAVGPQLLGTRAAQWLLGALAGHPGEAFTAMPAHLEIRQSCGCAS
jgi:LacI family transcriptional regulator